MTSDPNELPRLAPRAAESHKGDYGRALLIGGSRGMSGAIALAGMAALRAGAGLVTLGVPDVCLETVAAFEPCLMTVPLPCDSSGCLAAAAEDVIQLGWPRSDRDGLRPRIGTRSASRAPGPAAVHVGRTCRWSSMRTVSMRWPSNRMGSRTRAGHVSSRRIRASSGG